MRLRVRALLSRAIQGVEADQAPTIQAEVDAIAVQGWAPAGGTFEVGGVLYTYSSMVEREAGVSELDGIRRIEP